MTAIVEAVTAGQLAEIEEQLVEVYRDVFTLPPYEETAEQVAGFVERIRNHAARDSFRCAIAMESDDLLGFAYGYAIVETQPLYEILRATLGPELAVHWLVDAFYLQELAVVPTVQRQGLGRRLHDALLSDLDMSSAILTTHPAARPALSLYQKQGWVQIYEGLVPPGSSHPDNHPEILMGLNLR